MVFRIETEMEEFCKELRRKRQKYTVTISNVVDLKTRVITGRKWTVDF